VRGAAAGAGAWRAVAGVAVVADELDCRCEPADGARAGPLIAVAVAHVTQCPYCIRGHTRAALRKGATEPELMEAIWAAEMRAGGAYAHSTLALDTVDHAGPRAD
jgi:AhpD family alkylhydroperoxidase